MIERLKDALGSGAVKTQPEDLAVFSFDAYSQGTMPSAVVLPSTTREVAAAVKIAADCGEPVIARGAGTGLCGGAVPARGGIVFSFARMNRVLEIDVRNRRARVQPGLINLELQTGCAPTDYFTRRVVLGRKRRRSAATSEPTRAARTVCPTGPP